MNPSLKPVKIRHTKLGILLLIGPAFAYIVEQLVIGAAGGNIALSPILAVINILLLIIILPGIVLGILLLVKVI